MKKLIIQILFIIPVLVFAQGNTDQIEPDSTRQQVEKITRDGNEFIGEIVSENEQEIVIKTLSGITLTIPKNTILKKLILKEKFQRVNSSGRIQTKVCTCLLHRHFQLVIKNLTAGVFACFFHLTTVDLAITFLSKWERFGFPE